MLTEECLYLTSFKLKSFIRPVLENKVSQVLITMVVGYYATTKIFKSFNLLRAQTDDKQRVKKQLKTNVKKTSQQLLQLTQQDLMAFDGYVSERPIYTALNGNIYDLSDARHKFEPSGPYSLLAGCNANDMLEIACDTVGVSKAECIKIWEQSLNAEFKIVGRLIKGEEKLEQDLGRVHTAPLKQNYTSTQKSALN